MQADLEFDKAKALMEQQIQFITKRNQDLEEKEKKLNTEIKEQKQDSTQQFVEQKSKFEQKIQELSQSLSELED